MKTARKPRTCSAASAAGRLPASLLAGVDLFGQALAPVSPTPQRAKVKGKKTKGTSGRKCSGSSASVALQSLLASKSREQLSTNGSMEYFLTWNTRVTPAGRSYCLLRASGRRTSDTGFFGLELQAPSVDGHATPKVETGKYQYSRGDHSKKVLNLQGQAELAGHPTPAANEFEPTDVEQMLERRQAIKAQGINGNGFGMTTAMMAHLAGHPTPTGSLATKGVRTEDGAIQEAMRNHGPDLAALASLAGHPTPVTSDAERGSKGYSRGNPTSKGCALLAGPITDCTDTLTAKPAAYRLNPLFTLWLMGFPVVAWASCAVQAMQSSRK